MAKARVLVVEDEAIVAKDIQNMLKALRYDAPATAFSGEEAIKKVEEIRPDLVLMDIVLKGEMDGIEAVEKIRNRFNIPVVYLTAHASEKTLQRAKITVPFGYILKPVEERELHTTIEMALYKHEMENKLKESERSLSTILQSIGDAVIATDKKESIAFINPVAEALTGWNKEDALGRGVTEVFNIIDEKTRKFVKNPATKALKENSALGLESHTLIAKQGREISIYDNVAPIRDDKGNVTGVVLVFRDITDHKRAEEELRSSHEQLRSLSAHLQSTREQERTNIAREIHDELGQQLTALKMDLSWLVKRLPKGEKPLLEKTKSMSELIDITIRTVQRISAELRPGLLDDLGLTAAMDWQSEEFQNRTGIKCELALDPVDIVLDKDCSTAIFRIFQETLTNVARHANATEVKATLKEGADKLVLDVRDNGKGITEKQISYPKSFGLIGMRERVRPWGGNVKIRGTPGRGTTVTVTIPLNGT